MAKNADDHGERPAPKRPLPSDVQPVPPPGSRPRHWLHRPRRPLGVRDVLPHGGGLFLPVFVAAALCYGGVREFFGTGENFRAAGACALLGSACVTTLIILHLRRPPER